MDSIEVHIFLLWQKAGLLFIENMLQCIQAEVKNVVRAQKKPYAMTWNCGLTVFASLLVSGKYHPLKSHYFYAFKAFKAASCSVSAATYSPVKRRDIWKAEELKAFLIYILNSIRVSLFTVFTKLFTCCVSQQLELNEELKMPYFSPTLVCKKKSPRNIKVLQ